VGGSEGTFLGGVEEKDSRNSKIQRMTTLGKKEGENRREWLSHKSWNIGGARRKELRS